jgi:hypothetical protein
MIIRNTTELPNGNVLGHLHVAICTTKFFKSDIMPSHEEAMKQIHRWTCKWIKDELTAFANQREKAFEFTNLSDHMASFIMTVRAKIINQASYNDMLKAIDVHQNTLRHLLPSEDSQQRNWIPIINEIIHHAHHHLHQQQQRPVSGHAELAQK